jgi:hypothetical protein
MPMPAIQAVLRRQLESAASGNVRAQRDILTMIRDIERIRSITSLFENGDADDVVDDINDADDADAIDGDDVDDTANADRDDAGGADDDEPAQKQADGIDAHAERRQAEPEPVELVARVEPPGPAFGRPDDKLCETREHPFNAAPPPPGFAGAQPGLRGSPPTASPAVSAPQPEDAAAPPAGRKPSPGSGSGQRRGVLPRRNGLQRSASVQPARPQPGRRRRGPVVNAGKIREEHCGSSQRSPGRSNPGPGRAQAAGGHARAPAAPAERDEKLKTRC